MATLKSIRKRIASTKSTQKLTHAMKMIATSRMRRAMSRLLGFRTYNSELLRIVSELLKRYPDIDHPLLKEHDGRSGKTDIFVITSDRGLCGPFNETLLKHVIRFMHDKGPRNNGTRLFVLGKKGRDFFRRRDIPVERAFDGTNADQELEAAIERYKSGETDTAYLAYNRFKKGGMPDITLSKLLPARPSDALLEYCVDYIYEPSKGSVVDTAVTKMIRSNFKLAMIESLTAELSARMVAMDKATKNARDLIVRLTMEYNKARQGSITRELIDIVGGAEALK